MSTTAETAPAAEPGDLEEHLDAISIEPLIPRLQTAEPEVEMQALFRRSNVLVIEAGIASGEWPALDDVRVDKVGPDQAARLGKLVRGKIQSGL